MRTIIIPVLYGVLAAGCGGGGSSEQPLAQVVSQAPGSGSSEVEETSSASEESATRLAMDNDVLAFNRASTREELDKIGDALLQQQ